MKILDQEILDAIRELELDERDASCERICEKILEMRKQQRGQAKQIKPQNLKDHLARAAGNAQPLYAGIALSIILPNRLTQLSRESLISRRTTKIHDDRKIDILDNPVYILTAKGEDARDRAHTRHLQLVG